MSVDGFVRSQIRDGELQAAVSKKQCEGGGFQQELDQEIIIARFYTRLLARHEYSTFYKIYNNERMHDEWLPTDIKNPGPSIRYGRRITQFVYE